jgi:histidine triad (HIT) family protein
MDGCIFCKIVRGEAPAYRVHEDDRVLVFMDIFPVTDGHTLIVTKEHFENVL